MPDRSSLIFLSDFKSRKLQPKAPSAADAGPQFKPLISQAHLHRPLHRALETLLAAAKSPDDLVSFAAILSATLVQTAERAGQARAPWMMADLYERIMRDGPAADS